MVHHRFFRHINQADWTNLWPDHSYLPFITVIPFLTMPMIKYPGTFFF
ncbi:hypothetical protein [uncultured Methanoregula sp.]